MKLFGHDTSPYVRRARVLFTEAGLVFERDSAGWAQPSAEFTQVNPLMRVPALLDGEQALFDSRLIATYVYDHLPAVPSPPAGHPPLQPTLFAEGERYDDENALLAIDTALDCGINLFLMEQDGVLPAASPYLRRQAQRIARCLSFLEARWDGRDTLHPGVVSFTDISLCCALDWMTFRKRYDVTQHKNLTRFREVHAERPSLKATHPSLAVPAPAPRATC